MDRRELLGVLGATAAGLAAVSGSGAYSQEKKEGQKKGHQGHEAMAEKTGKTCSDCANDCNKGFHHCRGRQEGVRRVAPFLVFFFAAIAGPCLPSSVSSSFYQAPQEG